MGQGGLGGGGNDGGDGECIEIRRRGEGCRAGGLGAGAKVCRAERGGAISVAFVLEFVCIYRTPLF